MVCVDLQGDREKAIGLTVSPLMDRRHKGGITRSQVRLGSVHHQDMPCALAASLAAMRQLQLQCNQFS